MQYGLYLILYPHSSICQSFQNIENEFKIAEDLLLRGEKTQHVYDLLNEIKDRSHEFYNSDSMHIEIEIRLSNIKSTLNHSDAIQYSKSIDQRIRRTDHGFTSDQILKFYYYYLTQLRNSKSEVLTLDSFKLIKSFAISKVNDANLFSENRIKLEYSLAQAYRIYAKPDSALELFSQLNHSYDQSSFHNPRLKILLLDAISISYPMASDPQGKLQKYKQLLAYALAHQSQISVSGLTRMLMNGCRIAETVEEYRSMKNFASELHHCQKTNQLDQQANWPLIKLASAYFHLNQKDSAQIMFNQINVTNYTTSPQSLGSDYLNILRYILEYFDLIRLAQSLGQTSRVQLWFSNIQAYLDHLTLHNKDRNFTMHIPSLYYEFFQLSLHLKDAKSATKAWDALVEINPMFESALNSHIGTLTNVQFDNKDYIAASRLIETIRQLISTHDPSTIDNLKIRSELIKVSIALGEKMKDSTLLRYAFNMIDTMPSYANKLMSKAYQFQNQIPIILNTFYGLYETILEVDNTHAILDDGRRFSLLENIKSVEFAVERQMNLFWSEEFISQKLRQKRENLLAKMALLDGLLVNQPLQKDSLDALRQITLDSLMQIIPNKGKRPGSEIFPGPESYKSIQSKLETNELIMIFFEGYRHLYYLTMTKTEINHDRISLVSLEFLRNNNKNNQTFSINDSKFTQSISHHLAQYPTVKNIVIIPDGIVHSIPFESLTDEDNQYLINQYSISYHLSTYHWQQGKNQGSSNNRKFVGFAPEYGDNSNIDTELAYLLNLPSNERGILMDIPGSLKEVTEIVHDWNGVSYLVEDATLDNFLKEAKDANIIHLAMHAMAHDQEPLFSSLIFGHEPDEQLTMGSIAHMSFAAEMVVLSACESGKTNHRRAYGSRSIARGFLSSGAKSVIMSLWRVPDESTSEIMISFYKYLTTGVRKDEALRLAKLDYLGNVEDPELAHPYYWAGFVVFGDTRPLLPPKGKLMWWILSGVLVFGIGYLITKSKNKAA